MNFRTVFSVLVFVAGFLIAPPLLAAGGESDHDVLGMSISGGVSLGAYEAGLNWALIEYLRHYDEKSNSSSENSSPLGNFGTVAGSSAGSTHGSS